ncbi:unnamed protein product [Amoebophrya sp. A25]|nr:unnamed protein product [Amoebophrya sp. A25]|eukprot:GSA25T00022217001.1
MAETLSSTVDQQGHDPASRNEKYPSSCKEETPLCVEALGDVFHLHARNLLTGECLCDCSCYLPQSGAFSSSTEDHSPGQSDPETEPLRADPGLRITHTHDWDASIFSKRLMEDAETTDAANSPRKEGATISDEKTSSGSRFVQHAQDGLFCFPKKNTSLKDLKLAIMAELRRRKVSNVAGEFFIRFVDSEGDDLEPELLLGSKTLLEKSKTKPNKEKKKGNSNTLKKGAQAGKKENKKDGDNNEDPAVGGKNSSRRSRRIMDAEKLTFAERIDLFLDRRLTARTLPWAIQTGSGVSWNQQLSAPAWKAFDHLVSERKREQKSALLSPNNHRTSTEEQSSSSSLTIVEVLYYVKPAAAFQSAEELRYVIARLYGHLREKGHVEGRQAVMDRTISRVGNDLYLGITSEERFLVPPGGDLSTSVSRMARGGGPLFATSSGELTPYGSLCNAVSDTFDKRKRCILDLITMTYGNSKYWIIAETVVLRKIFSGKVLSMMIGQLSDELLEKKALRPDEQGKQKGEKNFNPAGRVAALARQFDRGGKATPFKGKGPEQVPHHKNKGTSSAVDHTGEQDEFILNVSDWDMSRVQSTNGMFLYHDACRAYSLRNQDEHEDDALGALPPSVVSMLTRGLARWDVSSVTDMSYLFAGLEGFNEPIGSWDVSRVQNFTGTFFAARSFDQPLGDWDTQSACTMRDMFAQAAAYNQPIGSWNTERVKDLSGIFHGATAFNQEIENWSTSKVTDLARAFAMAEKFNQPLEKWDVSKVTSLGGVFSGAGAFNQPLNAWDVWRVQDFSFAFQNAKSFDQKLDAWDVTGIVYALESGLFFANPMEGIFSGATSMLQPVASWRKLLQDSESRRDDLKGEKENDHLLLDGEEEEKKVKEKKKENDHLLEEDPKNKLGSPVEEERQEEKGPAHDPHQDEFLHLQPAELVEKVLDNSLSTSQQVSSARQEELGTILGEYLNALKSKAAKRRKEAAEDEDISDFLKSMSVETRLEFNDRVKVASGHLKCVNLVYQGARIEYRPRPIWDSLVSSHLRGNHPNPRSLFGLTDDEEYGKLEADSRIDGGGGRFPIEMSGEEVSLSIFFGGEDAVKRWRMQEEAGKRQR